MTQLRLGEKRRRFPDKVEIIWRDTGTPYTPRHKMDRKVGGWGGGGGGGCVFCGGVWGGGGCVGGGVWVGGGRGLLGGGGVGGWGEVLGFGLVFFLWWRGLLGLGFLFGGLGLFGVLFCRLLWGFWSLGGSCSYERRHFSVNLLPFTNETKSRLPKLKIRGKNYDNRLAVCGVFRVAKKQKYGREWCCNCRLGTPSLTNKPEALWGRLHLE